MMRMLRKPLYVLIALFAAAISYVCIAWIPLAGFLFTLLAQQNDPREMITTAAPLLGGSLFELAPSDVAYAIVLSLLTGMSLSMLAFYYRKARVPAAYQSGSVAGIAGFFVGMLGFGCAACGALFARVFLASIAGVGLADHLPQNALFFQVIGIGLILFSIVRLNTAISDPLVCEQ